jgi:hypothetical protein
MNPFEASWIRSNPFAGDFTSTNKSFFPSSTRTIDLQEMSTKFEMMTLPLVPNTEALFGDFFWLLAGLTLPFLLRGLSPFPSAKFIGPLKDPLPNRWSSQKSGSFRVQTSSIDCTLRSFISPLLVKTVSPENFELKTMFKSSSRLFRGETSRFLKTSSGSLFFVKSKMTRLVWRSNQGLPDP